jgi:methionine synthase I (cobalamin-dependent)
MKNQKSKAPNQISAFRKAARDLGADESEANFDAALSKIARHKAKPGSEALAKRADEIARGVGNKD